MSSVRAPARKKVKKDRDSASASDTTTDLTVKFLILALPAEIRNAIYASIFESNRILIRSRLDTSTYVWDGTSMYYPVFKMYGLRLSQLAILRTCKVVYREALPVLYRVTNLLSVEAKPPASFSHLSTDIPAAWRRNITTVSFQGAAMPRLRLVASAFHNLKKVVLAHRLYHYNSTTRRLASDDGHAVAQAASAFALGKHPWLRNFVPNGLGSIRGLQVLCNIWYFNKHQRHTTHGWEISIDVAKWEVLSVAEAWFEKMAIPPFGRYGISRYPDEDYVSDWGIKRENRWDKTTKEWKWIGRNY